MKQKALFLDIDDTLCALNKPIKASTIKQIKQLQANGWLVVFASGKPVAYISGMVRQTGLKNIMISGENGLHSVSDHHFPPTREWNALVYDQELIEKTKALKKLSKQPFFGEVWLQPNQVGLGVFFRDETTKQKIITFYNKYKKSFPHLQMQVHVDAVDIVPKGLNKGNMVNQICYEFGIAKEHVVAVGNGANDVAMFEQAGISIGINFEGEYTPTVYVSDIDIALEYVLSLKI